VALLVTGLICFPIFIFVEVPLLGVVFVMDTVTFALAHTLLVPFIFRIVLVLEKWSAGSLQCGHTADPHNRGNRQGSGTTFEIDFHENYFLSSLRFEPGFRFILRDDSEASSSETDPRPLCEGHADGHPL
jgi:hypothetical protein